MYASTRTAHSSAGFVPAFRGFAPWALVFQAAHFRPRRLLFPGLIAFVLTVGASEPARTDETAAHASITDKTLVVWATLSNTQQRWGALLTLENPPSEFDALILGEIQPGKWMAGSDYFKRTTRQQDGWATETVGPDQRVQLAIVYEGRSVAVFRDGELYSRHEMDNPPTSFTAASHVLFGLHHSDSLGGPCFTGSIEDARIYDRALTPQDIQRLQPDALSDPAPWAWWTFDEPGRVVDQQGAFPDGQLVGQAKVVEGRLRLFGGFVAIGCPPFPDYDDELWPQWHVHARREEGLCRPYDANGCFFDDGVYHLMYIYQDRSRPHDGHSWGHLTSRDLVNWAPQRPALIPEPEDRDVGIFSGNAFRGADGKWMLCWFGVNAGVCVATASDDAQITWAKHPGNPVIPMPKPGEPGHGQYTVWDPYMWFEDGAYHCLLGMNYTPDGKDTLFHVTSPDLESWTPQGPFYQQPDASWTVPGEDCSCPDFFRLGDKQVLMCISHPVGGRFYVGRYDQGRFHPEQHVRMNWPGGQFFAPESLEDGQGRRLFWAWVTDPRLITTQVATGSGVLSLPRELRLDPHRGPLILPAVELESLRRRPRAFTNLELPPERDIELPGVHGRSFELALEFDRRDAREVGVKVGCSPDGQEQTVIRYDAVAHELLIDASKSTLRRDVVYAFHPLDTGGMRSPRGEEHPCPVVRAPLVLPSDEPLRLRVFLDGPMLEVFANDRQCLTQQVFPALPGSVGVKVFARGGAATLRSATAWDMAESHEVERDL